jgi:transcriptional regulator NrdR family protein
MVCIYCGEKTAVSNSRSSIKYIQTWRRRRCTVCKAVVTSVETYDLAATIRVKNSVGSLEPFLRDKLLISLYRSLSHRKTALQDSSALTQTTITKLIVPEHRGILSNTLVRDTSLEVLDRFDKAAATHYKAHHQG